MSVKLISETIEILEWHESRNPTLAGAKRLGELRDVKQAILDEPAPLTFSEFQDAASRTLPEPGAQKWFFQNDLGEKTVATFNRNTDLLHAVLGLAGEAGELVDPVKKAMFYGKPLDVENVKEEAGDLLWYIAGPLCRALGCTFEELAAANVAKLRKRYPEKYTDAAAVARADKVEPAPTAYPAKPAVTASHMQPISNLSDVLKKEIQAKYPGVLVDFGDGYYWDEELRSWQVCPELWEPIAAPTTETPRAPGWTL